MKPNISSTETNASERSLAAAELTRSLSPNMKKKKWGKGEDSTDKSGLDGGSNILVALARRDSALLLCNRRLFLGDVRAIS